MCQTRIDIQRIKSFEMAQTVTQAHRLANCKNVEWLAQKGITLQPEIVCQVESSKKTKYKHENFDRPKILKDLVQSVILMLRSKNLSNFEGVPEPYLQIFFKSCNPPATISFHEFKRAFFVFIAAIN